MRWKELLSNTAGTLFVVALLLGLVGLLVLAVAAMPVLLLAAPVTVALIGLFLLVQYLRRGRR